MIKNIWKTLKKKKNIIGKMENINEIKLTCQVLDIFPHEAKGIYSNSWEKLGDSCRILAKRR